MRMGPSAAQPRSPAWGLRRQARPKAQVQLAPRRCGTCSGADTDLGHRRAPNPPRQHGVCGLQARAHAAGHLAVHAVEGVAGGAALARRRLRLQQAGRLQPHRGCQAGRVAR